MAWLDDSEGDNWRGVSAGAIVGIQRMLTGRERNSKRVGIVLIGRPTHVTQTPAAGCVLGYYNGICRRRICPVIVANNTVNTR